MNTKEKPIIQNFNLQGVRHILPEDALEATDKKKAVLIDVRERDEIYALHIKHALFLPMWKMPEGLTILPKDKSFIILCNKGIRSTHVANFLMNQGFSDVVNLDGGITAWKERNLPYEKFRWPEKSAD